MRKYEITAFGCTPAVRFPLNPFVAGSAGVSWTAESVDLISGLPLLHEDVECDQQKSIACRQHGKTVHLL